MSFAPLARCVQPLSAARRTGRLVAASLFVVTALAACGGGDQVDPFDPEKIVSFGDEASVLAAVPVGDGQLKGLKYTVNWLADPRQAPVLGALLPAGATLAPAQTWTLYPEGGSAPVIEAGTFDSIVLRTFNLDVTYIPSGGSTAVTVNGPVTFEYWYRCENHRLWIQLVANGYGLGYQEGGCPREASKGAVTYAEAGATVEDIADQVEAHRDELTDKTLVTVFAGKNDVLQAYAAVQGGATTEADAKTLLTERGQELGRIINDITSTGARALVVTLPDLGLTPLARATGQNRALLTTLTRAFNTGLISPNGVENDGHKVALVRFFDETRLRESNYDMATPLCTSGRKPDGSLAAAATGPLYGGEALLYCNSGTISGDPFVRFWADQVNLSPAAHALLGSLGYSQARDNPL